MRFTTAKKKDKKKDKNRKEIRYSARQIWKTDQEFVDFVVNEEK